MAEYLSLSDHLNTQLKQSVNESLLLIGGLIAGCFLGPQLASGSVFNWLGSLFGNFTKSKEQRQKEREEKEKEAKEKKKEQEREEKERKKEAEAERKEHEKEEKERQKEREAEEKKKKAEEEEAAKHRIDLEQAHLLLNESDKQASKIKDTKERAKAQAMNDLIRGCAFDEDGNMHDSEKIMENMRAATGKSDKELADLFGQGASKEEIEKTAKEMQDNIKSMSPEDRKKAIEESKGKTKTCVKKLAEEIEQGKELQAQQEKLKKEIADAKGERGKLDELEKKQKDLDHEIAKFQNRSIAARATGSSSVSSTTNKEEKTKDDKDADEHSKALDNLNKSKNQTESPKEEPKKEDKKPKTKSESIQATIDKHNETKKKAEDELKELEDKTSKLGDDKKKEIEKQIENKKKQIERIQKKLDGAENALKSAKEKESQGDEKPKEKTLAKGIEHKGEKTTLKGRPKKIGDGTTYFYGNDPNGPTVPKDKAQEMIRKAKNESLDSPSQFEDLQFYLARKFQ